MSYATANIPTVENCRTYFPKLTGAMEFIKHSGE